MMTMPPYADLLGLIVEKGGDGAPVLMMPLIAARSTDCASALSYLELYAHAKGLGTCWAGYFTVASNHHEPLTKALMLPAGHKCFGAVMLGYPRYRYYRIPKRNDVFVTWR